MRAEENEEPDWDTEIALTLTPAAIIHSLFGTADTVHTGWSSCVDDSLVAEELTVTDAEGRNHCRMVRQRYVEEEEPEETWNDWTVEIQIGRVCVAGHWRSRETSSPSELDWCSGEAEKAFSGACLLVGKRVRRGLVVEEPPAAERPSRTHH
jgi:hypothetical protein